MNFNLDTIYGYNNDIHKSKIIKYKPNNLATMNVVNTNIIIMLNREENHLNLHVPSIDPSNDNRIIVQKVLSKKNNVDFSYYERKTFYKNVPNATYFLFDLGMESGMERPQYIIVGFENNNVNEQTHDASTFDIMNFTE